MSQRAIYRKSTGSPQQQFTPTVNNGVGPQAKAFPFKHFITLPNGVVRGSRPARGESNYHNISTPSRYNSVPVKGIHSTPVIHYTDSGPEYDRQQYLKPPDDDIRYSRVSRERHNNVNIVFDSTSQLESSVGRYRKRSKSTPSVSDRSVGDWVDNSSVRQSTRLVSNGSVKGQYITNDEVIYANVNRGSIPNNRPPLFLTSPASKYVVDVNHTYSSVGLVHNNLDYIRPSSPLSVYSDRGSDYVSSAGSMRGDTVIYNSPSARQDVIMMGNYYDPRDIYVDNRSNGSLAHSRAKFSSMPMLYVDKATEKKIIKEEKKRAKEERKRFEKEEKIRKKAEKKAATLNAKTLPKSWGYDVVHRNIENTYPRPRLRMRAVPIEFEDGPYVPPPLRPRYVVKPNPGLQKKHFYTSTPNLQQAIYANTPSIQRVEQVYGTSSRYALKPHIPPTNKREYSPKTVALQRRPEGYGFVLRGARSQSHSASLEFQPTAEFPALQYLDSVDPGSQSDRAGLKTGDFILEINGENVVKATHERVVQLIRTSKESLIMKVVTARPVEKSSDWFTHQDGSMTLPNRKKQAPQPPRRNPDTSLSYSKATSKSMAEGLAEIEKLDQTLAEFDLSGNKRHSLTVNELSTEQKTASVRGSHAIKRLSCVDINHIVVGDHVEPADSTYDTPHKSKEYMSPAELRIRKYHKKQNGTMERSKSTPDLAVPDEVVYASTNLPGSGTTLYDRTAVNRTQMIYQKPGSPGHYRQGHMADVKRPMSQMNPDRLKTSVYAGPVVIRSNSEESDPPSIPGRVPVPAPKKPAPTPPGKSEVVSISTSRNDNVYANVSAEIQARKKEKEESPYESSFRPGTLARLTNQPKVTTASLEQAKLKSHSRSSSYGAMSLPQDEETSDKNVSFADDKTATNAASFIQKHPNAQLLVTADVHQKKDKKVYYEPEPDYDDSDEDKRSSNTTKLQVPTNVSRQSSVSSTGSKNASEKDVRPKSSSVTVIAVGDTTMKRKSPVTERHFAIHSDIPSTKRSTPQSPSGEAKIMIPPRPNEPAPLPPTVITNHYSSHKSSSSPNSSDSSRRSSVQSSLSGGKESYDSSPMNQAPATFPKPQLQESVHHTPPPQAPPPPPPPPAAPPVAPPVPSFLPTTPSYQESQVRSPPKQEAPQISASDIMNAVKLRQSRIETDGPRMVETAPSQLPPPKTPIDMNQLALKAAVEARKQRLKQENDTAVVDQIESRLHKTKKLQSAKYFFSSDTIKNENKNTETQQKSETPEKTPTAKKIQAPPPPNVKPKSPQVAPKTKAPATPLKTEVKSSPVPKPISSSTPVQKPISNPVTSPNEANDFLAMAEKARLEILQKKGGGTKNSSVTPIYSSSNISKSKKADSKTPEKPKEDPKLSIKDKIASFEKQKQEANGVTNGTNIELDGVTEDHSHTEAGNTLTRNGNSAYSPFMAPPPGFGDTNTMNLEIIPPPISFSNDASVDSGQGSDHFNSAFGHDDSASLVSSASTLSTLSSEQGEGKSHYEDIIAPPPPGFSDISEYDESDVIPPPPQFSSIDNKPKPLRPYQTKGVDTWLCTDVLDWLESLGMTQYKSSFAKNCIDGPKLLMLGRNDYIQLGVTQVGHRMNLERSIKKVALGKISTAM